MMIITPADQKYLDKKADRDRSLEIQKQKSQQTKIQNRSLQNLNYATTKSMTQMPTLNTQLANTASKVQADNYTAENTARKRELTQVIVPVTQVVQNFIGLPEKQNRVDKILNKIQNRNIIQKRHSQQSSEQQRRRTF